MYNSFYGGRRGASFVIVQAYKSIEEMVSNFQKGEEYEVAGFDEYVIIDTENKNDKDNGKIYKRGYDYTNELGGAIYVGQIVGPAGMAPHVEMKTIDEVLDLATEDNLTLVDENGEHLYRLTQGEYAPFKNLAPGKYTDDEGQVQYNDSIKYAACSVKDKDSHISTAHIGFIIPYPIFEYSAESVSPYYHRSDAENKEEENWDTEGTTSDFNNEELITREDDQSHTFFSKWHIAVPKGKKGESLKNFRVTTVPAESENPIKLQDYEGKSEDENVSEDKKRQILVYDYYNYDKNESGEPISLYLGDYNMIDNFRIDDDGTVTIDYSHDDRDIYKNLFKWVKTITLNPENGLFAIDYNYPNDPVTEEPTHYELNLTWVKDMNITEDGSVSWTYTTEEDNKEYPNFIKWIKNITLNAENGHFTIEYNYPNENDEEKTPTQYDVDLTWVKNITFQEDGTVNLEYTTSENNKNYENLLMWIKDISLDTETGLFTVNFNYEQDSEGNPTQYQTNLRWLKNVFIDEDGTIHFEYTHGEEQVFERYLKTIKDITLDPETGEFTIIYNQETDKNGEPTEYNTQLKWVNNITVEENGTIILGYTNGESKTLDQKVKWIKDIVVNTGTEEGSGNQKIKVTYNDNTQQDIGKPINYIIKTAITTDYHLIAYHSDPLKRQYFVSEGLNYEWEGKNDWQDLGSIKDDSGILVGLNLTIEEHPELGTTETAIEYLNITYPNGLEGLDLKGKIITVGDNADYKIFYAFDYSKENEKYKGWYLLGKIGSSSCVAGKEDDPSVIAQASQLPTGGIWFIEED